MYMITSKPGSVIGCPSNVINDGDTDEGATNINNKDPSIASPNFAVVRTLVEEINVLVLSRDGNKQFIFSTTQRQQFLEFQDDSGSTVWGAEVVP